MRSLLLVPLLALVTSVTAQGFTNFESPQIHPIEVSADGQRLYVVNTPDSRVGVYSLANPRRPVLVREIFVGLEPVTVRERTNDELWVVNHLSDSVSIVSLKAGRVTAILRVKDEPTDVVFAQGKAFVCVAGNDEVRVFDASTRKLLKTIAIFGDEPRNLLASPDGKTVWAVVHRSGNETTLLPEHKAPKPPKPTNPALPDAPQQGLIIHSEDPTWRAKHDVDLPDHDLVEIDVATQTIRRNYAAVGTINFGATVRPGTNEVWIANTEARNQVRFETKIRGHAVDNRVTRVVTGASSTVTPFDLNPNIDYTVLPNPAAISTALAQPTAVVWDASGKTMFVAAFGTDRIGMVDTAGKVTGFLEIGNTAGAKVDSRNKRGPRGLALHGSGVLFVLNRLSNSISAIDTGKKTVLWEMGLPDPTPVSIKEGRGFLYDAKLSGNGTFACAACHVDGDIDGIAWDLGDPGGKMFVTSSQGVTIRLHPMKGPMMTQTLKGLAGTRPFHWRGDKPTLDDFNPAFDGLMGKTELPPQDMAAFSNFMESIQYGSNPHRKVDDTLPSAEAKNGQLLYTSVPFRGNTTCNDCHTIPTGTNGTIIPGSILQTPQAMKVPQVRNVYKKLGFKKTPQGRKSGFGLLHDGTEQDMFEFLSNPVFGALSRDTIRKTNLGAFVEAFDTGTSRAVGFQVHVHQGNLSAVTGGITNLIGRAHAGRAALIARGTFDGVPRGFVYRVSVQKFEADTTALPQMTVAQLRQKIQAGQAELILMGVAPGNGVRLGIDRDLDGVRDGDEGLEVYGAGSAGCAGTPDLRANSEARVGNPWFALLATNAEANAPGILGIGGGKANVKLLGVDLLVDVAHSRSLFMQVLADARGELALPLPIPALQSLVGLQTYNQILWVDSCGPQGVAATQGLGVRITRD